MSSTRFLAGHRIRLVLFLLSAIVVFTAMYVLYSAIGTLRQLEEVESERDQWQRPGEVLQALALQPGNVVADLGSGAGYFALKLSPIVGKKGQVLAVDIRKLSLSFLWIRALLNQKRNIRIALSDEDNPRLPSGTVDAVLIANTFHELRAAKVMLDHVARSLREGGRLVVVDRCPRQAPDPSQRWLTFVHNMSRPSWLVTFSWCSPQRFRILYVLVNWAGVASCTSM